MSGWTKTKTYESHHFDSEAWSVVKPRPDDIVIATAYKSGTTWMQQIIAQLIFDGAPPAAVGDLSPWVDLRVPPRPVKEQIVEGLTNRRFLKTHLPTSALEYSADTKYVYVARDGRDAFMSLMNHYKNGNEAWYGALNSEGLVGDPLPSWEEASENKDGDDATRAVFDKWLNTPWGTHASWEEDGWPFWSLFYNAKTWWEARHLPNVLFVHFGDMKQDLKREMRRIAAFIGAPVDEAKFDAQGSDDEEDAPLAPEVEAALERVRASDEKRLYVELFSPYDDDAGRQASSQQRTGDGDDDDTLTYGKTRCRS